MCISNLGHLSSALPPQSHWSFGIGQMITKIYIHKHCLIFWLDLIGLLPCIVSTEVHTKHVAVTYCPLICSTQAVYKEAPWQLFILKDCTTHSSSIATVWILMSTRLVTTRPQTSFFLVWGCYNFHYTL